MEAYSTGRLALSLEFIVGCRNNISSTVNAGIRFLKRNVLFWNVLFYFFSTTAKFVEFVIIKLWYIVMVANDFRACARRADCYLLTVGFRAGAIIFVTYLYSVTSWMSSGVWIVKENISYCVTFPELCDVDPLWKPDQWSRTLVDC